MPGAGYVETPEIRRLIGRASTYFNAGIPLHFRGPAGVGKSALARRLAEAQGRPISTMSGHDWLDDSDFVGRIVGQSQTQVVDNYIQSIRRAETSTRVDWSDALLAEAMEQGHTFIYDDFTCASPQANALLLPVLEEGILVATDRASLRPLIRAHPKFRIILTSNPADYVAATTAPDALLDRMVTIDLSGFDADTEAAVVSAKGGVDPAFARRIVACLRALPSGVSVSSLRAAIMIARAATALRDMGPEAPDLSAIARDVISGRAPELDPAILENAIATHLMPARGV
ncbi:MAG: MoxR family ATPase [Pseudomonadota bacterium]